MRLLLLGGTSEASALARCLGDRADIAATLSLAGRTANPAPSPLPTRIGGFGGAAGLAEYLAGHRITVVIDATHPFAARMSAHAVAACGATQTPLAALTRRPWVAESGDDWREVDGVAEAATALGASRRRVLLTIGRQQVSAFRAAPQHHYVLRAIEAPDEAPPDAEIVLGRPPFSFRQELDLMRSRRIEIVVAKNAGGVARAKLDAARELGLPVVMIRPPPPPAANTVLYEVEAALRWIGDHAGAP